MSQECVHGKVWTKCPECNQMQQICIHGNVWTKCPECDEIGVPKVAPYRTMETTNGVKRVYICGPYEEGDKEENVARAIAAWHALWREGFVPFCPHLSHFLHLCEPLPYEDWMAYDHEWLRLCHCVLRLSGDSPGSDRECADAKEKGIPVFYEKADLIAWRDKTK